MTEVRKVEKVFIREIVLAEDDADDREYFGELINHIRPAIKVRFVTNGVDLMNILRNFIPDLLFLDLEMPHKNGLQCLVEIRETPGLENLPVVIFSSTSRLSNMQTAYEMGAHLFLYKSASFTELASSVNSLLNLDWSDPVSIRNQYFSDNKCDAFR
jgi:CheY-like chemotaxis protein